MLGLDCLPAVNHQPEFTAACITGVADQAVLGGAIDGMAWTCVDLATDGRPSGSALLGGVGEGLGQGRVDEAALDDVGTFRLAVTARAMTEISSAACRPTIEPPSTTPVAGSETIFTKPARVAVDEGLRAGRERAPW